MIIVPIVLSCLAYIILGVFTGAFIHGLMQRPDAWDEDVEPWLGGIFWPAFLIGYGAYHLGRLLHRPLSWVFVNPYRFFVALGRGYK